MSFDFFFSQYARINILIDIFSNRYIEIFRSSLSEVNGVLGYSNRRSSNSNSTSIYNSRPSPYDRGDRFGNSGSRFQSRGRTFKGSNFSTGSDYGGYDRGTHWNNSHNGSDSRGERSPYEIDSWGDGNSNLHCVHMRGLPFKATTLDISDVIKLEQNL